MASFTVHGVLGAGVAVSLGKLVGQSDYRVYTLIYGAITGMAPDVFDWIAAKMGWAARWVDVYDQLHSTWHSKLWAILLLVQPPLLVGHFLPDKIFHANSPDWWPRFWWLEILMWLVGAYLIYWGMT